LNVSETVGGEGARGKGGDSEGEPGVKVEIVREPGVKVEIVRGSQE
jgi:hypothetical protein